MRDARSRVRWGSGRCVRTYVSQSRMRASHHCVNRVDEVRPCLALLREDPASFRGEPIETASPLAGLLDPAPLDPAAGFEAEQRGVERRQRECQLSPRAGLDQLADFIPVTRTSLEQREDQHLATALLQFGTEHVRSLTICSVPDYID